jgi:hypothetical protein
MTDHSEGVFKMKTNSSVPSGKFWLAAVSVALFLLPVTAAAQAANSGRDRRGNINRGRAGVVTTVEPGETLDLNAKLKIRSGGFFLGNTALLRGGRGNRLIPSSPPFAAVVLGTTNASDYLVFNAGGAERARISTDGNVGIGTTGPGAKLSFADLNDGRNTADGITWYNPGPTLYGIYRTAGSWSEPDYQQLAVAWQTGIVIDGGSGYGRSGTVLQPNGGNVGIGTTTPSNRLSVTGVITSTGHADLPAIVGGQIDITGGYSSPESGRLIFGDGSGWQMYFSRRSGDANTDLVTFQDNGNVGIGTKTFSSFTKARVYDSGYGSGLSVGDDTTLTTNAQKGFLVLPYSDGNLYIDTKTHSGGNTYFRTGEGTEPGNARIWLAVDSTNGNVGIGTTTPSSKLHVAGSVTVDGNISAKYQDVAEWVPSSEHLASGTVVVLDSTKSNQVISSSVSYDTRVAGVISAQPGIALGEKSDSKVLVATTGRVKVKVDASKGPIHIGDLLVTSDIPGVAMKSEPVEFAGRKMHMPGTLIGKALEPLTTGKGEILVLLSLQ